MKEEGERDRRYLLECMIGIVAGMGWDNGAFHSMDILGNLRPIGFKILVIIVLEQIWS